MDGTSLLEPGSVYEIKLVAYNGNGESDCSKRLVSLAEEGTAAQTTGEWLLHGICFWKTSSSCSASAKGVESMYFQMLGLHSYISYFPATNCSHFPSWWQMTACSWLKLQLLQLESCISCDTYFVKHYRGLTSEMKTMWPGGKLRPRGWGQPMRQFNLQKSYVNHF